MRTSIEEERSCLFSVPKYHAPVGTRLGVKVRASRRVEESSKVYYQIGFGIDI